MPSVNLRFKLNIMDIRKIIKQQGFTLTYVAERMTNKKNEKGVSLPSFIQTIDGNPTFSSLQEIANIIGVSLSELVADENNQHGATITCPHCGKSINIKVD